MHLTDEFLKDIWCEFLAKNSQAWLRVTTGSMEPLVKPGEKILIKKVQPQSLAFGDIVIFEVHDLFVAHRVMKKRVSNGRMFFLQKGDKGDRAMEIPEDWVIGKVVAIEKIKGPPIELDKGLGRYINYVFGCLSLLSVSFYDLVTYKFKFIPKIHYLKRFYGLFKGSYNFFYRGIITLLMSALWLRQKVWK